MKSEIKVPDGWEIVHGSDSIMLDVGSRPKGGAKTEGDIPSLGGEHINRKRGIIDFKKNPKFISYEYFKRMNKGRLKEDDIIINKDGAWTGKVAYVKDLFSQEIAINEHLFIIRSKGSFVQKYLFYYLEMFSA